MIEEIDKMGKKIGRNDKCPCGSRKKYKYCCINKMPNEELENLYMEQYYLTKGLKKEDACNKILKLGKEILSSNSGSPCIIGTYVNMAVAERILYYIKGQQENLLQAQSYCYESLKLKHNNQAAIAQCFGICLELRKYKEAKDILELYDKDEELKNPLSVQVIEEYQAALGRASNEEYNKEIKIVLDKITNVLLRKYNTFRFQDADGVILDSIASDNSINDILYEALGGLIQVYNSQKKYELARTYAAVAKEKLPEKNDWEIWLKVLPEIENKTQLYETVKQKLEQSLNENKNQKNSFRLWAQQLIQLQDNVNGLDLDDNDEWGKYEEKMNEILAEMSKLINKEGTVYQQKLTWINTYFPTLDLDAKGFLITAEVLFELHKSSTIDFAPIIVELVKL